MDHGRSYDEKEIGRLIERATELNEEAEGVSDRHLSLEEVEQLAAELGLPVEHLRTAALELEDVQNGKPSFSIWGGPFTVDHKRVIPAGMTEAQWEQSILEIQRAVGSAGQIKKIGTAREWTRYIGEGEGAFNLETTQVTMQSNGDQTSVRIQKRYTPSAILAYLATVIPGALIPYGFALTEGASEPISLAVGLGIGLTAFLGMRSLMQWASRKKKRTFKTLSDRLHNVVLATPNAVPSNEEADTTIEASPSVTETGSGLLDGYEPDSEPEVRDGARPRQRGLDGSQ